MKKNSIKHSLQFVMCTLLWYKYKKKENNKYIDLNFINFTNCLLVIIKNFMNMNLFDIFVGLTTHRSKRSADLGTKSNIQKSACKTSDKHKSSYYIAFNIAENIILLFLFHSHRSFYIM